jgi:hypothetical protein
MGRCNWQSQCQSDAGDSREGDTVLKQLRRYWPQLVLLLIVGGFAFLLTSSSTSCGQ